MRLHHRISGALVWGVPLLVACNKLSEEEFVYSYTEMYCTRGLECLDPALAVFDGINSTDACEAEIGDEMAAKAAGCKIVRKNAELCLEEMATLSCPAEGDDLDADLPSACPVSWKKCALTAEDLADDNASE